MEAIGMSPPSSPLSSPLSSPRDSSPLSIRSKSPTPPCDYPSPSSSRLSESRASSKSRDVPLMSIDGPPPAKKRKLMEPKVRTTERLDLCAIDDKYAAAEEEKTREEFQLERLLKALRTKQKIVVIAGAGISVSAGIPDFRSSTGLFKTLRSQHKLKASGKHLFDAAVYKSDDSTASFHDMVREMSHMTRQAKPTSFHHMLATLAEEGRLLRLYTQNVDGIDTSLKPLETIVPLNPKGPWPKTIQLHGGLEKMVCTKCGDLSDFDGSLFEGAEPPSCKACEEMDTVRTTLAGKRSHGIGRLRPRMVLYNEFNPDEEAIGAVSSADLRSRPDAVIVVGTSLKVPGVRRIAREMCQVARGRRDGFTAWINNGPEPTGIEFKDCWDLVVRGDSDEVARLVNLPKWDDKDIGMFSVVTGQTFEKKTEVKVKIELKNKAVEKTQGIITPTASPRRQSPAPVRDLKKMKQSTLMLSGSSGSIAKTTSKKSKPVAKRPVGRPPKTANINKITNSFTTTKSAKAPGKSQKKEIPESPPQVMAPIFPNLFKPKEPTTMLPISANDLRNNHDSLAHVYKEDTKTPRTSLGSEIEESPSAQLFREGQPRETISPKSIPNGFARLMDC